MATTTKQERNDGPVNEPSFLDTYKGKPLGTRILGWALTLDHKRIGMMYLFGILGALIVGGVFALLVRTELWSTGKTLVEQNTYNKFFTLHGAVMVFLVIIPGLPAALGNIILPIQLGAPDVAFPKLNLTSFYLWLIGALMLVIAIPLGGLDTGWTLYTPYSLKSQTPVLISTIAVFILGFSSIFTGLNML